MKQPAPREINRHLWAGTGSFYVALPDGRKLRVSRVRVTRGVMKGRVASGSDRVWEEIPPEARIELLNFA